MEEAIKNFSSQFSFVPQVEHGERLGTHSRFSICAMGGSALPGDIVASWDPSLDITVHRSYGLPARVQGSLVIACSYSGTTEEVLDGFEMARARRLPLAVITKGGDLLARAREHSIPYVQLPDTCIQPRMATGLATRALLAILASKNGLKESSALTGLLDSRVYEDGAKKLAASFAGWVPVFYSSLGNAAVAYNWKIIFNETAKSPAFYNTFPEINHNEMTGFDIVEHTRTLSERFRFILLADTDDHPRIAKRMKTISEIYSERSLPVTHLAIEGSSRFHKIFSSIVTAHWTAYYLAGIYGVEAEAVPLVEDFKKRMSS